MKIAIPTRNNRVDDHFGHCEYYTIFTLNDAHEITATATHDSPEGCGCKSDIAPVLAGKGITLMLAGNMGDGAKKVLSDNHIQVIRGCSGPVEEVIKAWIRGELTDSGDSCDHHDCPGHPADEPLTFKVIRS